MPVLTGTLQEPYEVLDSILAYQIWRIDAADYNIEDAFAGVKNKLRDKCKAIGGNAVISCHFQYKLVCDFAFGGTGDTERACLLGYGTAVVSSTDYNNNIVSYNNKIFTLVIDSDNSVKCPVCGGKLRLDEKEINLKYFECPNCNNEIQFEKTIKKL